MSDKSSDDLIHKIREQGARYVVGAEGNPIAVLLTLKEYEHYLDLLDDEADSRDNELSKRLGQAAVQPARKRRQSFRDYLRQRETSHAEVQG